MGYTAGWITVPGKGKRWRTAEGEYLMQRPAGSQPGILQAIDRALGGWLPGGGVASPLTRARQEGEQKWAEQIKKREGEYVGQPGRFAGQGQIMSTVRAITEAGANPIAVAAGNPEAIKRVSSYYANFPNLQNQYDLNTNLFLRYLSGTGAEGLKVTPEVGKQLYADIKEQERKMFSPEYRQQVINNPSIPDYLRQNIVKGRTPVYYGGSSEAIAPAEAQLPGDVGQRWQLQHSLGSYWAEPSGPNDGYTIRGERYNFNYAPISKEGIEASQNLSTLSNPYELAPLSPVGAGRSVVRRGYGTPYKYSLQVDRSGNVQVIP